MSQKDKCFDLIRKMSISEKGYFKRVSAVHAKGMKKDYFKLFDILESMDAYDTVVIRKKGGSRIYGQLANLKNYLYNQLLDSLQQYHTTDLSEINNLIGQVKILYHKGLKEQGEWLLKKAEELSTTHEKFQCLLQVKELEHFFLSEEGDKKSLIQKKEKLLLDFNQINLKLENLFEYYQLRAHLKLLILTTGSVRGKSDIQLYRELLKNPLLQRESNCLSITARYLFHSIKGMIYYYVQEIQAAYNNLKSATEILDSHPHLFEISDRIKTLQRKSAVGISLNDFETALDDLHRLRNLEVRHHQNRELIFQYSYLQEFTIFLMTGRLDEMEQLLPDFETEYNTYHGTLNKVFEIQLISRVSIFCFIEGRIDAALKWNELAMTLAPKNFREDLMIALKIQEVLIHLELQHFRLLKSLIIAAKKYIRVKQRGFDFEKQVLVLLEKLILMESAGDREALLKSEENEISRIFTGENKEVATTYLPVTYLYVWAWVVSKVKKSPLHAVYQAMAKKHQKLLSQQPGN